MKIRATGETAAGLFIDDTVPEESAAQLRSVQRARHRSTSPIPDIEVVPVATADDAMRERS